MAEVNEIVLEVKGAMVKTLSDLVLAGLEDANLELNNQPSLTAEGQKLHGEKTAIANSFGSNVVANFDGLTGFAEKESSILNSASLSLMEENDLEAVIAMEGMIARSRNADIQEYIAFTTRLDRLLPNVRIDESNNPMDPEQIGDAFKEAIQPVGLSSEALMLSYRYFNSNVFHKLESALTQANKILIDNGIFPKLDLAARNKKVQKNNRAFSNGGNEAALQPDEGKQLFSMMQSLVHGGPAMDGGQPMGPGGNMAQTMVPQQGMVPQMAPQTVPAAVFPQPGEFPGTGQIPVVGHNYGADAAIGGSFELQTGMMVGNQQVQLVEANQLTAVLNKLQLNVKTSQSPEEGAVDLNKSIGELLQQQSDPDTLSALDNVSSDVINFITMLYEAIWQDETIQIPIKELIGRTQITALKIALDDPDFFEDEEHSGRLLINELATAGIGWTDFGKLEQDPMYQKMLGIVESLIANYDGGVELLESLLAEFNEFKDALESESKQAEERLKDSTARQERLEEVRAYALEKISERILHDDTGPFVRKFLEAYFHRFLMKLILKEGPGGVSWKPVMNTIDVLLWTVQKDKTVRDLMRFKKLGPRLMHNLKRALKTAGIPEAKANASLNRLRKTQRQCFAAAITEAKAAAKKQVAETAQSPTEEVSEKKSSVEKIVEAEQPLENQPLAAEDEDDGDFDIEEIDILALLEAASKKYDLPDDDEHLMQVNKFPLGIWLLFQLDKERSIRCTLAAKIPTIDKYVFVNKQGVKVIERSRMDLAKEFKAGLAKILSESGLVDRAMESVIGKLREGEG